MARLRPLAGRRHVHAGELRCVRVPTGPAAACVAGRGPACRRRGRPGLQPGEDGRLRIGRQRRGSRRVAGAGGCAQPGRPRRGSRPGQRSQRLGAAPRRAGACAVDGGGPRVVLSGVRGPSEEPRGLHGVQRAGRTSHLVQCVRRELLPGHGRGGRGSVPRGARVLPARVGPARLHQHAPQPERSRRQAPHAALGGPRRPLAQPDSKPVLHVSRGAAGRAQGGRPPSRPGPSVLRPRGRGLAGAGDAHTAGGVRRAPGGRPCGTGV
mmetsp:Transcript_1600/g.6413  ORF Transcript_1600/g.6413 Transcript_1600/m.6413 type:complete len:266 (-) Transcript_1600:751-1548(-)